MAQFESKKLMPIVDPIMIYLEDSEYFKKQFNNLNTDQKLDLMEDLSVVAIKIRELLCEEIFKTT